MHAGAGEGLGAGEDAGQRVLGPWPLSGRIGRTDQIALDPHRDRGADFPAFDEVRLEGVTDLAEAGSARAFDEDFRTVVQRASTVVERLVGAGDGDRTRVASLEDFLWPNGCLNNGW